MIFFDGAFPGRYMERVIFKMIETRHVWRNIV